MPKGNGGSNDLVSECICKEPVFVEQVAEHFTLPCNFIFQRDNKGKMVSKRLFHIEHTHMPF